MTDVRTMLPSPRRPSRVDARMLTALLMCAAAPAAAQDSDTAIEQVPASAVRLGDDGAIRPVAARDVSTRQDGGGARPAAPQVGSRAESRARGDQLTTEGRGARAPEQLYRGGRTAQPPAALSRPSEGRTGAVARVTGVDRCDRPRTDPKTADPALIRACARAIEGRAADFARPEPVALSPEQRLLVEQRAREAPNTLRNAARRLAGDGDADTMAGQGVASVALRPDGAVANRGAPAETDVSTLSPEAQALIQAVVGAVAAPPRP